MNHDFLTYYLHVRPIVNRFAKLYHKQFCSIEDWDSFGALVLTGVLQGKPDYFQDVMRLQLSFRVALAKSLSYMDLDQVE